ncbi:MAG: hypothetical protein ACYDAR_20925 [Thermomicrobiales bacterium]
MKYIARFAATAPCPATARVPEPPDGGALDAGEGRQVCGPGGIVIWSG